MTISDAESVIMEVLWEKSPQTADDVALQVTDNQNWSAVTVRTLLNRLLKKGAVTAERDGRRYLYRPVLAREAYVDDQSQSLLNRLFGGRVAPLVTHFSEKQKLSAEDVAELKLLIKGLEQDD